MNRLFLILISFAVVACANMSKTDAPDGDRRPSQVSQPIDCELNGAHIKDGAIITATDTDCSDSTSLQEEECVNGTLTGSKKHYCRLIRPAPSTTDTSHGDPTDCRLIDSEGNRRRVPFGYSIVMYKELHPLNGGACTAETRTCGSNNELSGTFNHTLCSER
jgi:hypothetical protein